MEQKKQLLRAAEVAERLGISRQTLYRHIKAGLIPAQKLGGVLLIPSSAVERFTGLEAPRVGKGGIQA